MTWHYSYGDVIWVVITAIGLLAVLAATFKELRAGHFGVDVLALMGMAGCLALGEYLAGAVIAVMFLSGQALERYAQRRANRELTALANRAPRHAYRIENEQISTVEIGMIGIGDELLVKSGDVIPVDGRLRAESAVLDESALTGEAMPVTHDPGELIKSGVINVGTPFRMTAVCSAKDSTYAGIVRMVQRAQASRAPMVRLADKFAWWFFVVTLLIAAVGWMISGQIIRALAVVVVATPCPLIIAAPVAIVAGMSRIARAGIILKGGAVLESLSRVRVLLFDKTGTLTSGNPVLKEIVAAGPMRSDEMLVLGASLDQVSSHPLSAALRQAAARRSLTLLDPLGVVEKHGEGLSGRVGRDAISLGKAEFVGVSASQKPWVEQIRRRALLESMTTVFLSVNGKVAGVFMIADSLRPDASRTLRVLRQAGIQRIVMVTGDHPSVAQSIAAAVGLDAVMAEHSPSEKALAVEAEGAAYGPTAYVGDGINDAPALATADVGIAIGSRGISAASEAADAVLIGDHLDPLAVALRAARRSRFIALQSIVIGIGLSTAAMVVAAAGYLVPVGGAFLQEGIDLLVILNALRALGSVKVRRVSPEMTALSSSLRDEHLQLQDGIDRLRTIADRADVMSPTALRKGLHELVQFIEGALLPHELVEERRYYPLVAKHIGGDDPTAAMMRGHVEIARLSRLIVEAASAFDRDPISDVDVADIRRLLYSLHAVLTLHNAQEEEAYLSLAPASDQPQRQKASL